MPTGYTAGIIDGDIKDFSQFAKLCMRNFGALIHLRDEPMNSEYKPREVGDYHPKKIKEAENAIQEANLLSDEQIVTRKVSELKQDRERHLRRVDETIEVNIRLNQMLQDVKMWTPPSNNHNGLKEFMIQQLTETIKWDGDPTFHNNEISRIDSELNSITPTSIRKSIIEKAEKELQYHKAELARETNNCNLSNEWVRMLLDSINDHAAAPSLKD